jgi:hypothetical protein
MGKFGIGARVRDDGGDDGVIVDKRKGTRLVKYDYEPFGSIWQYKFGLTALPSICPELCEKAYSGDGVSANMPWVPKVGDRVRFTTDNPNGGAEYGAAGEDYAIASTISFDGGYGMQVQIDHAAHLFWPSAPISALEPVVAPLTIEAGKFYRTRDGRKVGPMMESDYSSEWPFQAEGEIDSYRPDGTYGISEGEVSPQDLVAEWVEPESSVEEVAVAEATATPDEAPKFKDGQKVRCIHSSWGAAYKAGEIYEVRKASVGHISTVRDSVGSTTNGWSDVHFELATPAAPSAKFKVGDRVVITGNSRGHDWLERDLGKDITIETTFGDGGYAGKGSAWWWPGEDLTLLTDRIPVGATVTFTATGRLSAVNDNGHYQVTFPDLLPGQNSFSLPARYVALAN